MSPWKWKRRSLSISNCDRSNCPLRGARWRHLALRRWRRYQMATPKLTPEKVAQVAGLVAQYIATQRERYAPRAIALSAQQTNGLSPKEHRKRKSNPRLAKKRTPPPNGSGVHDHFCLSFSLGGCFLGGGGGVFGLASGAAGRGACL